MKKSKLCFLPVSFLLLSACIACEPNRANSGKLATPKLELNAEKNGLTWAAVPGAVSYSISVNDEEAVTVQETNYDFEVEAGAYDVKVVAKASDSKNNSDQASFSYSTLYTTLGQISCSAGVITWANYLGAGIEYQVDDGEPVAVQGNSINASQSGIYTVRALPGFDENENKYYVHHDGNIDQRAILVQATQASGVVLEDGEEDSNTDLQEKYVAQKYDSTNGWVDTLATVVLDDDNPFSTGKCVKANIWHHGAWFKWTRELNCEGRIESVKFFVKGAAATRFALSFDITEDVVVGPINLKGVYATYMVQPAPQNWAEYTVSTNDANWTINYNGTSYPFATVQTMLAGLGYNIQSVGDFFPYFGSYSIKAFGEYQDGGPVTAVWFDQIELGVEPTQTVIDEKFEVAAGQFAFKSSQINAGLFEYNPDGQSMVKFYQGSNPVEIPVTVVVGSSDKSMTITSTATGLDFVAKLVSNDAGKTFTLSAVSGTAAPYMQGMQCDRCQILNNFEQYTATGQGLDNNHTDATQRTGLRADFFSDFYDGGNAGRVQSIIGGSGWSLMGSSDYLDLATSVAHTGSKSMRLKYNSGNQMRFLSYNLADGSGAAYEKGSYLSMWVRANLTRDNVIKFKAFYINKVEPSTQSSCDEVEFTVPHDASQGWVEVKVPLKATRTYYGFAILPMKGNGDMGGDSTYFYVDNIAIYSSISPIANA